MNDSESADWMTLVGTGTLEEALAWLEYCNGVGDSEYANMRRSNTGRHEPHKVKYWGLGNESELSSPLYSHSIRRRS